MSSAQRCRLRCLQPPTPPALPSPWCRTHAPSLLTGPPSQTPTAPGSTLMPKSSKHRAAASQPWHAACFVTPLSQGVTLISKGDPSPASGGRRGGGGGGGIASLSGGSLPCHVVTAVLSGESLSCRGGQGRGRPLLSNALHEKRVKQHYQGCSDTHAYTALLHHQGMLHDSLLAVLSVTQVLNVQTHCRVNE